MVFPVSEEGELARRDHPTRGIMAFDNARSIDAMDSEAEASQKMT